MVGRRPKTHLAGRKGTACGITDPRVVSSDPAAVTCAKCRSTVAMADREMRVRLNQKKQPS